MKQPNKESAEPQAVRVTRKWWRRYGEGDWRWSDQSWQTETNLKQWKRYESEKNQSHV